MPMLRLPYPPSANRLWRVFNGHTVKSPAAKEYQKQVQVIAMAEGVRPSDECIALDVTLHPKKPKRDTGARVRSLDLSNCIKIAEDALNGIAWVDDEQVQELSVRRGPPIDGGALIVRWGSVE